MITKNNNREQLLSVLKTLEGKRKAAAGLKILVEKNLINENQIMQLLHSFLEVIYETQTKTDLKDLKKIMNK